MQTFDTVVKTELEQISPHYSDRGALCHSHIAVYRYSIHGNVTW